MIKIPIPADTIPKPQPRRTPSLSNLTETGFFKVVAFWSEVKSVLLLGFIATLLKGRLRQEYKCLLFKHREYGNRKYPKVKPDYIWCCEFVTCPHVSALVDAHKFRCILFVSEPNSAAPNTNLHWRVSTQFIELRSKHALHWCMTERPMAEGNMQIGASGTSLTNSRLPL